MEEKIMKLEEKIDQMLLWESEKIDWKAVEKAAKDAAEDIHGSADMDTIKSMIENLKNKGTAKDTEDAVQIVINMMRS